MDTYGYMYRSSFDASTPSSNLLASDDDSGGNGQFQLTVYLTSGTTYILVVTTYIPGVVGPFSIIASGPAIVVFTLIVIPTPTGTTVPTSTTTANNSCNAKPGSIVIADTKPKAPSGRSLSSPITYHGGPVMTNSVIYVIWYGNWTANNGTTIIQNFLQGLGSTAWWNITRRYNNTSPITFGRSTTDSYSQGKILNESLIFAIVQRAINSGALPNDTNGVYFVLTSADCTESYFCRLACGWHTVNVRSNLKYSWVGNPEQLCPSDCSYQLVSPNGNAGADAMVSVIAHEAAETVSDPYLNAWYDSACDENADKCAWTFGSTSLASNGAAYNMVVNGLKYLVQQNWRLTTQDCGML
ncbi:unnamed protein product [Rotaria sp. Silwood2]|nr:unnamed protein product [Rotaria sp. Silwood2]